MIHVVGVLLLNMCFSHVAELLTHWENHQTVAAHQNSVILKRFCFEAFDAYIGLIYLTVYEQNIAKVRAELVAVYTMDTFRRVFMETLLPWVTRAISSRIANRARGMRDAVYPLHAETELDEYDSFDDYLEMVIQWFVREIVVMR